MPEAVEVRGKFVNERNEPMQGTIKFVPSKIWVVEDDVAYPTLAPEIILRDGICKAMVTRTDQHDLPWHYTAVTPIGNWTIKCEGPGPLQLKSLLPKRFA